MFTNHILLPTWLIGGVHSDGRPQVCWRAAEEKTIWRLTLFTTSSMLGGKSIWSCSRIQPVRPHFIPFARRFCGLPFVENFWAETIGLSFANSTSCIELLVHRDLIKHVVSVTKLSKAMLYIECVFAVEGERGQFQRAQLTVCSKIWSILTPLTFMPHHRKAHQSGGKPAEISALAQINCGRACWSPMCKFEGPELLLD